MLLELMHRRTRVHYRIADHDQLNCVVTLHLDLREQGEMELPPAQVRATAALTRQIDKSIQVLDVELSEDGELEAISVKHDVGDKMAAAGAQARVERIFETMHPGRWRAHWDTIGDTVRFEQRPTLEPSIWLPTDVPENTSDLLSTYRDVKIPYGVDEDGQEVVWRPAVTPHMLITGETGSGKTSVEHSILGKITQYGWPVWVGDGKGVEFLDHRDWPNVQMVATTFEEQIAMIHKAHALMLRRYEARKRGVPESSFEPLVLILDEWAETLGDLGPWYAEVRAKNEPRTAAANLMVQSLLRRARTARIHVIISLQRPDVQLLGGAGGAGGEARSNLGQRISVGRLDPHGALMMWNNPKEGTRIPRGIPGRAVTNGADGQPIEAQLYRFPSMKADAPAEEVLLREALRPAAARHPRLVVGQVGNPTLTPYQAAASAPWFTAKDRPDLDPLNVPTEHLTEEDIQQMVSTASILDRPWTARDLGGANSGGTGGEGARADESDSPFVEDVVDLDDDNDARYEEAERILPAELEIGDLIELDDALGGWAVVDAIPEIDALDDEQIAISWRDDGDQYGAISLAADTPILARRPRAFPRRSRQ